MDRLDETSLDKLVGMVKKENTYTGGGFFPTGDVTTTGGITSRYAPAVQEVKDSTVVEKARQGDLQALDSLRSWCRCADDSTIRHLDDLEKAAVRRLAEDLQPRIWRLHLPISVTIHEPNTPAPPAPGPEPIIDPNPTPPAPDHQPSTYDDPNAKVVVPLDECLCGGPQGHLPGGVFCRA